MVSLRGLTKSVVIPREAMGMGDVHLLAMIGALFGWNGVIFSLFSASLFALIAALIGRISFGKQLPFGPYIALGATVWMFGGWKIWRLYLDFLGLP
jgi:leader peptidase (prepilin peptidase)/N-methyltransferase